MSVWTSARLCMEPHDDSEYPWRLVFRDSQNRYTTDGRTWDMDAWCAEHVPYDHKPLPMGWGFRHESDATWCLLTWA